MNHKLQMKTIEEAFKRIQDIAFDMVALIGDNKLLQEQIKPISFEAYRPPKPEEEMPNTYLSEGTIIERKDGRYEARIYRNGRQETVGTLKFKSLAEERLRKAIIEKNQKPQQDGKPSYTFYSWLDFWKEKYMKPEKYSKGYLGAIDSAIKNHIKPNIPDFPLDQPNIISIETAFDVIPEGRTAKSCYDVMNQAFGKAFKLHVISYNFILAIEKPNYEAENGIAFNLQDQKIFLEAIETSYLKNLFLFELYSGCRPGEVRRAKPEFINYEENTLFIDGTKTKTSKRKIPLFPKLKNLLKNLQTNSDFLFSISADKICDEINRIYAICEFEQYNQYSLRHTFATGLHEQSIDDFTIALWMGHSSTRTTKKVYIESQPEFQQSLVLLMQKGFD